jgi:hypothetical protein
MTMPSTPRTGPTDSPDPQRPENEDEQRRGSWRLRRRERRDREAAEERIKHQGAWVDVQIQQAVARGDFDDLPGYGKPLRLTDTDDPDWWVKGLVERENITGVLPPALQIRKDDAALDGQLDRLNTERQVREAVTEFNAAVRRALYSTWGDPPVVTSPRDVDAEVARWRDRRTRR